MWWEGPGDGFRSYINLKFKCFLGCLFRKTGEEEKMDGWKVFIKYCFNLKSVVVVVIAVVAVVGGIAVVVAVVVVDLQGSLLVKFVF